MKTIVFDAGPIISLTTNNLLWTLEPLKQKMGGDFLIPTAVKGEIIDRPINSKKFQFEAIQVLKEVHNGTLTLIGGEEIDKKTKELLEISNSIYVAKGQNLVILHEAEMQVIATAIVYGASAIAIDERSARQIIEDPKGLKNHLERKLHTHITINHEQLETFLEMTKHIKVIRSTELATIAYEIGLLDKYYSKEEEKIVPNLKRKILESMIWSLKLNGCSISNLEIERLIKHERIPKD